MRRRRKFSIFIFFLPKEKSFFVAVFTHFSVHLKDFLDAVRRLSAFFSIRIKERVQTSPPFPPSSQDTMTGSRFKSIAALALIFFTLFTIPSDVECANNKKSSPSPPIVHEPTIEEVTAKQLERILAEKDYVAVYWCKFSIRPMDYLWINVKQVTIVLKVSRKEKKVELRKFRVKIFLEPYVMWKILKKKKVQVACVWDRNKKKTFLLYKRYEKEEKI